MFKNALLVALLLSCAVASAQTSIEPPAGSQIKGVSGNGNGLVTTTGPGVAGDGGQWDANGNWVDSGSAAGGGSLPSASAAGQTPVSTGAGTAYTAQALNKPVAINVSTLGAVCNGSSHPASGTYGTLAALQAVYSFATALTNEMDWLAIQQAVNNAGATTWGGTVQIPSGNKCIMDNSSSASDGSGQVTLPAANDYVNGGSVVNLVGVGDYSSALSWPSDLGTGKCGVVDANRIATTLGNMGLLQKLVLVGPGSPTPTLGTAPANMNGACTGAYKRIRDFTATGFYAGIASDGSQQRWSDVTLMNNYYNIYEQNSTGGLLGDIQWDRVTTKNATLADVAVAQDTALTDLTATMSYFGYAPYSFYKETNSGAPTVGNIFNRFTCISCKAEGVGNAMIADDQNSSSSKYGSLFGANLQDMWFSWGSSFQWTSKGRYAIINALNANFTTISITTSAANWVPGTSSIFNINNYNSFELDGDINTLIANANAASVNSIFNNSGANQNIVINNTATNRWSGFLGLGQPFTAIVSGQFGAAFQDSFASSSAVVQPSVGTSADNPVGVVMYVDGGNSQTGRPTIIATSGTVSVNASGTWSTTTAQLIRTAASGAVAPASSSADPTSPIIGSIGLNSIPSTTTPTSVTINLSGGKNTAGASPATANPLIDGTATPGTSLLYARQDHVHPTDTTRAPVASPAFTTQATSPLFTTSGTAPTIANGAAAGTSPGTPTVTGHNQSGVITLITGSATTAAATLATITFNGLLATAPQGCDLMPRNAAASAFTAFYTTAPTTTGFTVATGATAAPVSSTLVYSYQCL
jgi:hypothetical protein